jgi:hypothetical protein
VADARVSRVSLACSGKTGDNPLFRAASRSNLAAGSLRASLVTTLVPQPGSDGAYQIDPHFMIRCEPKIMNNLANVRGTRVGNANWERISGPAGIGFTQPHVRNYWLH